MYKLCLCLILAAVCCAKASAEGEMTAVDKANFFLLRGDEFLRKSDYSQAIAQYTKAIELKPDFAEAYNNRGYATYSKYDGSDVLLDLNRALELRPDFVHAYNTRGCVHMARGEIALAIADFNRAIELQGDYPRAYRNRASCLLRQGHFAQAFLDFERAGARPWRVLAISGGLVLLFLALVCGILRRVFRAKRPSSHRTCVGGLG